MSADRRTRQNRERQATEVIVSLDISIHNAL